MGKLEKSPCPSNYNSLIDCLWTAAPVAVEWIIVTWVRRLCSNTFSAQGVRLKCARPFARTHLHRESTFCSKRQKPGPTNSDSTASDRGFVPSWLWCVGSGTLKHEPYRYAPYHQIQKLICESGVPPESAHVPGMMIFQMHERLNTIVYYLGKSFAVSWNTENFAQPHRKITDFSPKRTRRRERSSVARLHHHNLATIPFYNPYSKAVALGTSTTMI